MTRSTGGSVWAVPKSSRDGTGTTTSRGACPAPVLASRPPAAERPISYEFQIASIFTHIHSRKIRTKFVRISREFRTEFLRI